MKKSKSKKIVWTIILVAVAAVVLYFVFKPSNKELNIRAYVVKEYTIENSVTATGTIEPVESVQVGTQVSGEIKYIYVDYNSTVKKGQKIAELDKKNLLEQLNQSESNLRSAQSQLEYAQSSFTRTEQLFKAKAATQVAYDEARNSLVQAQTNLSKAQSSVDQAKTNLAYAEIYSPIDGVVLSREVEVGQTVAASYSTPTLFKIARDLTQMQVEAAVDEADIGQVREGQDVTFTVDAYTEDVFVGTVKQIRLQPTTTSNVVTYTVIISAPNPSLKLFPGMTASVNIITEQETGIAIPSEALSFTPDERVLAQMRKEMHKNCPEGRPEGMPQGRPDGRAQGRPDQMQQGPRPEMVWVKRDGLIHPQLVKTGMSDGVFRIVTAGVSEGDSIVLSVSFAEKHKRNTNGGSNPFMPGPPGKNKRR